MFRTFPRLVRTLCCIHNLCRRRRAAVGSIAAADALEHTENLNDKLNQNFSNSCDQCEILA